MARRRRGGRRGGVSKWVRRGVSIAAKAIGGIVIFSPFINAVKGVGFSEALPDHVVYEYTGFSTAQGSLDPKKMVQGIGTVVAGVALMKFLVWVGRSF